MLGVFWITEDCNMRCVYCYEGLNKKKAYMSKETIDRGLNFLLSIAKEIKDNVLKIEIHGGEPLMAYKEMQYLINTAKERCAEEKIKLTFGCTTNATLLNKEKIDFICKEIQNFTISMDGAKETQNYTRPLKNGGNSYEIVEENLKKMLLKIPDLRVRLTYNHTTVEKLYENVTYLAELGVKYIVPARDFFDQEWENKEFAVLKTQLLKIKRYLDEQRIKNVHVGMLDKALIKRLGKCSGGIDSFHLGTEGKLYPCALAVGNEEFVIGDVKKGINKTMRDKILSHSMEENAECLGCAYYECCEQTRCKIINKIIMGDFCKPSSIACMENNVLCEILLEEQETKDESNQDSDY